MSALSSGATRADLSAAQQAVVDDVVRRIMAVDGVVAMAVGGSRARGHARPDSDIDLGVFYSERAPLSTAGIRGVAASVNDTPDVVVSECYEWGPWVNGGAWLSIGGQRIDLLYRSLEHLERAIEDANAGRWQLHFGQQAPFGFFSATYLGELAVCLPLADPVGRIAALKARVAIYPEALRGAVVRDALWQVEFGLCAFARTYAKRGDIYGAVGCLARAACHLVLALFALNRVYLLNDKTALTEIGGFAIAPAGFADRIGRILSHPGADAERLQASLGAMLELFADTVALSGDLYTPRYALPTVG